MTLRLRLLLGYGYLVALVLVAAGSALLGFLQLSSGIGTVLEENVKSIGAAMRMVEALERLHGASVAELLRAEPPDIDPAAEDRAFREALAVAADNVTEEQEPDILATIEREYGAYREAVAALLAAPPERPIGAYERSASQHFRAVKLGLFRLLDVNHDAIIEADRRARQAALANGAWLGALVAVSLLSFVFLSRAIQTHILARLDRLRAGSEAVAEGDTRRRLLDHRADELGRVAAAVDRLLDRLQQAEGRSSAEVRRERRLTLALLASHGPGAAVFDLDGRLLAGEPEEEVRRRVREWAGSKDGSRRREGEPGGAAAAVDLDDGLRARPLRSPSGGQVAWLVHPATS